MLCYQDHLVTKWECILLKTWPCRKQKMLFSSIMGNVRSSVLEFDLRILGTEYQPYVHL